MKEKAKEKYETAVMEIIEFESEDVIRTSGYDDSDDTELDEG